jgi:hypothetical protein
MSLDKKRELLSRVTNHRSFLGREFLTYLWYRIERVGDSFSNNTKDGDAEPSVLFFERRMVLSGHETETTVKHSFPVKTEESRAALRLGRQVNEVTLVMDKGGVPVAFSLKASDLNPRSVALPKEVLLSKSSSEQEGHPEEILSTRLESVCDSLQELNQLIETLFEEYLSIRRDPAQLEALKEKMTEWASSVE